ncbi:carboxypeptidase regulatory-like domain-containing protein [Novosphingobium piscinae]|uniref:TonB-dependent receptor n=1 Tax=Novosphingobium piscinae TaxID=1507448 RepID=A0A7X1G0G6_9SPHN|nr:TonB-dependent receptor [Novosphingobium piscinae]MBC2670384.1 TonB-dependent receptor [Novosphingobium piscinae]
MHLRIFLAASAASLSLACALATPAMAQETSSSVRGLVTGSSGPLSGATVVVRHEPSGTVLSTTTGDDGTFAANGLRIGGPFTVTVEAPGYESSTVNDLFLQAGQPVRLPIALQEQTAIVVTANAQRPNLAASDGLTTVLNRSKIDGVASINRDVRDLARRDPLVTVDLTNSRAMEIAGNNGRLNRFSVDGVQLSDDFGLNNGGLPTSRGPVPFDAIEQFSVKVAPFDIAEGDFQGGAINVVVRSGTNQFHGSAFYTTTNEGLTGNKSRGVRTDFDLSSQNFGGLLAGPIIKDKLFFMIAYERARDSFPYESGVGAGVFNQVPLITQANIDQVSQIAQSTYNYNTLGFRTNQREADDKGIAKLDWNISDKHRMALTYIYNLGTYQVQQNTFLTPVFALGLESNAYVTKERINTGTVEINSTWSDSFSTTVRGSYRDYNRDQNPVGGRGISNFEVCLDPTSSGSVTACNTARLFFGPDVSRHTNLLRTSNLSLDFIARLNAGDHDFRFISGYTRVNTYNVFIQRSLGDLYFDSIADFQARRASRFRLGGAVPSLVDSAAAADFQSRSFNIGLQDDWQVTEKLQLTIGARYDLMDDGPRPPLNPNFLARQGYPNTQTFRGRGVFQPRAGFKYDWSDRLKITGGVGIFSGGTPDVYLSNVFSNTGLLTNQIDIQRNTTAAGCNVTTANAPALCNAALNNVTGANFDPAVFAFLTTNVGSLAQAPTDVIDPNLKLARKLKSSIQVDYDANLGALGDHWLFGAQFLYDRNIYGYMWTDVRSAPTGGVLPDGRPRYNAVGGATTNRDLLMTNSRDGRAWFATARFAKSFGSLSIDGSYTRSNVKDIAALTSSTSSSNYQNNVFVDPNIPAYGRSIYEYTDQWKFSIDYKKKFFKDAETRISLFGEYRSGRPYSITMLENTGGRGNAFGTVGNLGKMLLYVPTLNDAKVSFDSAATEAAFNAQIEALGLGKYRGTIVPKNSQTSPGFFKVDLHIGQQLPLPIPSGMKFEVFADIENVLNLINPNWGSLRQVPFDYTSTLVRVACLTTPVATGTAPTTAQTTASPTAACAQYRYSNVVAPQEVLQTRQSLYGVRIGARLRF